MFIVKPDLYWSGKLEPLDKSKIDGIALHHMAHPTWKFEDIHNYHQKTNGWIGIGYNWWVAKDGTIYQGRGFNKGAGVGGHNSHLISIGFQGDYQKEEKMPKEQYEAGVELIKWLCSILPNVTTIDGHKHWNKTSCPRNIFSIKGYDRRFFKRGGI